MRTLKPLRDAGTISYDVKTSHFTLRGINEIEASLPRYLLGLSSRFGETAEPVAARLRAQESDEDQ